MAEQAKRFETHGATAATVTRIMDINRMVFGESVPDRRRAAVLPSYNPMNRAAIVFMISLVPAKIRYLKIAADRPATEIDLLGEP